MTDELHAFRPPPWPEGWKPATLEDAQQIMQDMLTDGIAFATKDGYRVPPEDATIDADGKARSA